jgi:hypothetical protein
VPTEWKVLWGITAAAGAVLLVLGVIATINAADFCAGGSHYERFWFTAAFWFIAAPAGALLVARRGDGAAHLGRRQLIYLAVVLCLALAAVVAWRSGAVDVPLFRDRDFPFGETWGCGL